MKYYLLMIMQSFVSLFIDSVVSSHSNSFSLDDSLQRDVYI